MSIPLLAAKTPCELEGRNFRRGYREPQIGKVYTIHFEVDKETWDACELIPKTATIKGVMWWEPELVDDVPAAKPEVQPETNGKKAKAEKGSHGAFWSRMFRNSFYNHPDLLQVLDCVGDQVRLRLHDVFETDSLTHISAAEFEQWCASEGLESLITMSRLITAKLNEEAHGQV